MIDGEKLWMVYGADDDLPADSVGVLTDGQALGDFDTIKDDEVSEIKNSGDKIYPYQCPSSINYKYAIIRYYEYKIYGPGDLDKVKLGSRCFVSDSHNNLKRIIKSFENDGRQRLLLVAVSPPLGEYIIRDCNGILLSFKYVAIKD